MDQEQESSISSRLHVFGTWRRRKIDPRRVFVVFSVFILQQRSTIIVGRMEEQKEKLHKRSFALAGWDGCSQCCFLWNQRRRIKRRKKRSLEIDWKCSRVWAFCIFDSRRWRSGSVAGNDQLIANRSTDRNYTWRDFKARLVFCSLIIRDYRRRSCVFGPKWPIKYRLLSRNNFFTALIAPFGKRNVRDRDFWWKKMNFYVSCRSIGSKFEYFLPALASLIH